jgi:hypothetical protein
MKRVVVAAGLAYAAALVFNSAAFAAPPIVGTGTVGTCTTEGKIKIKPGLTNGGTAPAALKIKAKSITCDGSGTGDGANVTALKGKGTGTTTSSDCANLVGAQPADISLEIKWKVAKGTPKLAPSTATFTSQTGGATGDSHGTFDVTGTITAGSFMGNPVTAHVETEQTLAEILTACGEPKGLKKISFSVNSNTGL